MDIVTVRVIMPELIGQNFTVAGACRKIILTIGGLILERGEDALDLIHIPIGRIVGAGRLRLRRLKAHMGNKRIITAVRRGQRLGCKPCKLTLAIAPPITAVCRSGRFVAIVDGVQTNQTDALCRKIIIVVWGRRILRIMDAGGNRRIDRVVIPAEFLQHIRIPFCFALRVGIQIHLFVFRGTFRSVIPVVIVDLRIFRKELRKMFLRCQRIGCAKRFT